MSTRSGLRPRRSVLAGTVTPTATKTPTARRVRKPVKVSPGEITASVSNFRISSEAASSPILPSGQGKTAGPQGKSEKYPILERSNDVTFLEPKSQPLYPNLASLVADADLYPSLQSKAPSAVATTRKKRTRVSLDKQMILPVTPTKPIDNSIPRTAAFEFTFSAGLEEAGKKVLEELKLSSVALQIHMKEEATRGSARLGPGDTVELAKVIETNSTTAKPRRGRFSGQHRKLFSKMPSISDHYSAKPATAKHPVTPTNKTARPGEPKSPHPLKTLKRKTAAEADKPTIPFKPPSTLVTSDTEVADESPIQRKRARIDYTPAVQPPQKMGKFSTPGYLTATPIAKPLQAAGHQHGISRSAAMKSAMKQSSLPRLIRKEAIPSTPSKPLAIATPFKKETLLASPSKVRPSGETAIPAVIAQPATPSPIKDGVSVITPETFGFKLDLPAPLFDTEMLHKVASSAATTKPSVRFMDATLASSSRLLFDGIALKPTLPGGKRKIVCESEPDEDRQKTPASALRKRICMDFATTPMKGRSLGLSPMKLSTPNFLASARKITQPVKNPFINALATPKKRTILSPRADKKVTKPRWR